MEQKFGKNSIDLERMLRTEVRLTLRAAASLLSHNLLPRCTVAPTDDVEFYNFRASWRKAKYSLGEMRR